VTVMKAPISAASNFVHQDRNAALTGSWHNAVDLLNWVTRSDKWKAVTA
jgi:hypothetical protein